LEIVANMKQYRLLEELAQQLQNMSPKVVQLIKIQGNKLVKSPSNTFLILVNVYHQHEVESPEDN